MKIKDWWNSYFGNIKGVKIMLVDQTNSLCSILEDIDVKESFDYVYLDSSCFEAKGQIHTTKHYPLNDLIKFEGVAYDSRDKLLEQKLNDIHKSHVTSLRVNMLKYMEENPNKRGTVYFSPASTFATINTEAKSVYMFGLGCLEDESMEILSESNYLII